MRSRQLFGSFRTRASIVCGVLVLTLGPRGAAGAGPSASPLGPAPATAELFLPGIVSTALYERDVALAPDRGEIYFGVLGNDFATLAVTRRAGKTWTPPEIAPFSGGPVTMDLEPAFSPDGRRLYFLSTRPDTGQKAEPGWVHQAIWYVERTGPGWSEPHRLGTAVNSGEPTFFPSVANDGTLYFTRGANGKQQSSIWRARPEGSGFAAAEKLPAQVNCTSDVFNAVIAPDQSFIVTCVFGHAPDTTAAGYYVNFRAPDDRWSEAVPVDSVLGIRSGGVSASISRDGHTLFLASTRRIRPATPQRIVYRGLRQERTRPGNGNSDVYWVDTAAIAHLRPRGF